MVASGFIDDIARGSRLWDRVNLFDGRVRVSDSTSTRDSSRPLSTMFIEDALVNR